MLDIADCIGMKGVVLGERYKEKDAYYIFTVISQCLEDSSAVGQKIKPFLAENSMELGVANIKEKFRAIDSDGPSWIGIFMSSRDEEQKKRDPSESFVLVSKFLKELEPQ